MHESQAKAVFAGFRRKTEENVEKYTSKYRGRAKPRTRKAWFRHQLTSILEMPGTVLVSPFVPAPDRRGSARSGKTLAGRIVVLEPVKVEFDTHRQVSWALSIFQLDAKHYAADRSNTKIWIGNHAIERVIQRMDFWNPMDALGLIANTIRDMPLDTLTADREDLLIPVIDTSLCKEHPVGAFVLAPDKEHEHITVFRTFLRYEQLSSTQRLDMLTAFTILHRKNGNMRSCKNPLDRLTP